MGRESTKLVNDICKRKKAWSNHHVPTAIEIDQLLQKTDYKTTIITCTRRGTRIINSLCVQVLFRNRNEKPIGNIQADYEANDDNYDPQTQKLKDCVPVPEALDIYIGLRIVTTKNRNKKNDSVNGMTATVSGHNEETNALLVLTQTGKHVSIYLYTDDDVPKGRVTYYPVRVGYANPLHKFQGAELEHVTLWLDRPGSPAAAYVALSRVKKDTDYLIGGVVTPGHFTPAR